MAGIHHFLGVVVPRHRPGQARRQHAGFVAPIPQPPRQPRGALRLGAAALVQQLMLGVVVGRSQQIGDVPLGIARRQAGRVQAARIGGQVIQAVLVLVVGGADAALVRGMPLAVGAWALRRQVQVRGRIGDHVLQRQAFAAQGLVQAVEHRVALHQLGPARMAGQHDGAQGRQAGRIAQLVQQVVEHLQRADRRRTPPGLHAELAVLPGGAAPGRHGGKARVDGAGELGRDDQGVFGALGIGREQRRHRAVDGSRVALDPVQDDHQAPDAAQVVALQVLAAVEGEGIAVPGRVDLQRLPLRRRGARRHDGIAVGVGLGVLRPCAPAQQSGGQQRAYAEKAGYHGRPRRAGQQLSWPINCFRPGRSIRRTSR
ncbi:Uncharacterised protein [Bordetella pertussis]|nr:Uncharacterised protein [Bordetella pertussis]CFL86829.1 Uncharacterised protein [Bordetella pertussis]CFM03245.1 Uncharacterised protein [Bordetella pertussis]CFM08318.1 Uncharacterised protein [Bordetella pertussis]CFM26063.1 Uncharacterised protein [Bordetella pertussis]